MDIPIIRPAALRYGDTVAVVAPAGPLEQPQDLQRGIAALERMGFCVRYEERNDRSHGYLAGRDEERAEELMRSFEDPGIRAILALRGGYGCSRLFPHLDPKRLRNRCKIFMGFSDITTLHLLFRRRFGWITFHGPVACSPTLASMSPEQEGHLISLWTDPTYLPSFHFPDLEAWRPGTAEGELAGGCLSLAVASLGTPYEIATERKVLFFEDLGEAPYRIDRMLTQLRLAGKLDNIAGLLLGSFREDGNGTKPPGIKEVLKEAVERLDVPVIANFPSGHGPVNWAFPLGVRVCLDTSIPRVQFLDPAVCQVQRGL
jgi:muramoyltetrapeptide carboxypeptidase